MTLTYSPQAPFDTDLLIQIQEHSGKSETMLTSVEALANALEILDQFNSGQPIGLKHHSVHLERRDELVSLEDPRPETNRYTTLYYETDKIHFDLYAGEPLPSVAVAIAVEHNKLAEAIHLLQAHQQAYPHQIVKPNLIIGGVSVEPDVSYTNSTTLHLAPYGDSGYAFSIADGGMITTFVITKHNLEIALREVDAKRKQKVG